MAINQTIIKSTINSLIELFWNSDEYQDELIDELNDDLFIERLSIHLDQYHLHQVEDEELFHFIVKASQTWHEISDQVELNRWYQSRVAEDEQYFFVTNERITVDVCLIIWFSSDGGLLEDCVTSISLLEKQMKKNLVLPAVDLDFVEEKLSLIESLQQTRIEKAKEDLAQIEIMKLHLR